MLHVTLWVHTVAPRSDIMSGNRENVRGKNGRTARWVPARPDRSSASPVQIPVRRLGYRLALDYKTADRGTQGSWQGALLIDGTLTCPHIPATLANATHRADDKTVREIRDNRELTGRIAARAAFHLKTKEGPDDRGSIRLHCPAAGPSPSVNCARRDRLRPRGPRTTGPPPAVLDLTDARRRAAHLAAKPTVQLPPSERLDLPPANQLPAICWKSAIAVPADASGDLKTAKFPAGHPLPLHRLDRRLQAHPVPQRRDPRPPQERRDRHRQPQTPARTRPGRPERPRRHPGHRRQPRHPRDLALPAHRHPPHRRRLHR